MKNRRNILILILFLFPIFIMAEWFSPLGISESRPEVCVSKGRSSVINFNLKLTGFNFNDATTKGGIFTQINIPGAGIQKVLGKPELPAIRRYLEVPYGGEIGIKVKNSDFIEYDLNEIGIDKKIKPSQMSVIKIPGGEDLVVFKMDEKLYNSNTYYPSEDIEISSEGTIRGKRYVQIAFYPIQ